MTAAKQLDLFAYVPRPAPPRRVVVTKSSRLTYICAGPQDIHTANALALYRHVNSWKDPYWFCQLGGKVFADWLYLCWDRGYAFGPDLMEQMGRGGAYGQEYTLEPLLTEAERVGWIKRQGEPWETPSERFFHKGASGSPARQQLARAYTYRSDLLTREVVCAMRAEFRAPRRAA
jgi:hypothetical protein